MRFNDYIREYVDILRHPASLEHPVTWGCVIVAGTAGFGLGELFGLLFI